MKCSLNSLWLALLAATLMLGIATQKVSAQNPYPGPCNEIKVEWADITNPSLLPFNVTLDLWNLTSNTPVVRSTGVTTSTGNQSWTFGAQHELHQITIINAYGTAIIDVTAPFPQTIQSGVAGKCYLVNVLKDLAGNWVCPIRVQIQQVNC